MWLVLTYLSAVNVVVSVTVVWMIACRSVCLSDVSVGPIGVLFVPVGIASNRLLFMFIDQPFLITDVTLLFLSVLGCEALKPDLEVMHIGGKTADTALFVDYPFNQQSDEQLAKRRRTVVFNSRTKDGQVQLVRALGSEFGLREDRFVRPARLQQGEFHFGQTCQRKEAFKDLLTTWKTHSEATSGRNRLALPAVPAAPGTGKTRFAWLVAARGYLPAIGSVDKEWTDAMKGLKDGAFKTGIQNAVGVAVTFNCDAEPLSQVSEKHEYMIGVRMLYGHFCDVTIVEFASFFGFLCQHGCQDVTPRMAVQMIEKDIEAHHPMPDGTKRHIILVVDEPLRSLRDEIMSERQTQLGVITSSVGHLITNCPHVHVLMTSLSGSDLATASRTASGRPVHFVKDFAPLSKDAVELLIDAEANVLKKERLQRNCRFRAVLNECLGVPRLLEKVFVAAGSAHIFEGSSCGEIRLEVGHLFDAHEKYRERELRRDALIAAFSGPWRPCSQKRREQTRAAEREGYLFAFLLGPSEPNSEEHQEQSLAVEQQGLPVHFGIPPLLLRWWWTMADEQGQADETHALLKAAVEIYALSDEVGAAEHGPRFELQLSHLWRILTITDAVSRRESPERPSRRTIRAMLGGGLHEGADDSVAPTSLTVAQAAFNQELGEQDVSRLLENFAKLDKPSHSPTAVPSDGLPGRMYFPEDKQNPGFDFTVVEPSCGQGRPVQVLVEAKFSGEDASTELSQKEIVDKFANAVKGRPFVKECLLQGRLCYVIGGLRNVQAQVLTNRDALIGDIVTRLESTGVAGTSLKNLIGQSLVLLTRKHVEVLLTPTLASLPPFVKGW